MLAFIPGKKANHSWESFEAGRSLALKYRKRDGRLPGREGRNRHLLKDFAASATRNHLLRPR